MKKPTQLVHYYIDIKQPLTLFQHYFSQYYAGTGSCSNQNRMSRVSTLHNDIYFLKHLIVAIILSSFQSLFHIGSMNLNLNLNLDLTEETFGTTL